MPAPIALFARCALLGAVAVLTACGEPAPAPPPAEPAQPEPAEAAPEIASPAARAAFFGAVHVHTNYSFDAYTNGALAGPADAYKWARGEAITGGRGAGDIKIKKPLDFYAVSDHAEWMGVFREMGNPESPLSKHPLAPRITSDDPNEALQAFAELLRDFSAGKSDPALIDPVLSAGVWQRIVEAADAAYVPGTFTTFPAFEWTANPEMRNLHRVVVFRDSAHVPELPLSSHDSSDPEALWAWMEQQRDAGSALLAIPHNGNASDGLMFSLTTFSGEPIDTAYAETRMRNEPLYEITQIKGTSETHPELSPNDEFAGFEQWDYTLSADALRPTHRKGSFARQALLDGLSFELQGIGNPFRYGFIGDSDTHNAAASHEEDNYTGKFAMEHDPAHRLKGLPGQPPKQVQQIREFSSAGLAGVWADANTREAIFDAMTRRETFGTTGPMITLRVFAGWDFTGDDLTAADAIARGYARGVPMGASLSAAAPGAKPTFMVWAMKDATSGNLDRVQIVKGWLDAGGAQHETVHDVAWSNDRNTDGSGQLQPVGNTVKHTDATYTNTIGAGELSGVWQDPDFDPAQHAFYYVRVLEIPTPRWSTRDSALTGIPVPDGLPVSIQERAYSSPIWYRPG